jgi:hypothetical protein
VIDDWEDCDSVDEMEREEKCEKHDSILRDMVDDR